MDAAASIPDALGDFRIVAVLGQGGSGIVYDASWGPRRVALKVLHPALVGTERLRAQFLAEAARLQTIAHPSVVKVLAVGELPDGRPYLAMERLEGETLAGVLARGPLALPQALALFEELCDAVGALHDQGLIHRDLKPENVFVVSPAADSAPHAVLLDFGIAKELAAAASTTTIDGGVRGTPAYMAPERFFGQPAGVATDVYELAVTLYAMLAGQLPWDDLADPEARLQPRPLVELVAVPDELDVEIRRALSTRAQNRPASARAFHEAVRLAVGMVSVVTAPSETARMVPASDGARATVTADRQPWFAQRKATTDRGSTPLAWAPTQASPASETPPARRRWPYLAALAGIVAVGGGLAAWRIGRGDDDPAVTAAALQPRPTERVAATDDPWATGYQAPVKPRATLPALPRGASLSAEAARTELAAAIEHVPADTQVVFTVVIGELRDNAQAQAMLEKLAKDRRVVELLDTVPCLQSITSGSDWAVFAARSLEESHHGTLMLRGRWTRADVEHCLADQIKPLKLQDGDTMLELPRAGWIDFIDDHTIYISVRDDLAAAQVHDLAKRGRGPTAHMRELLGKLPAARTITAVVDGSGKLVWPGAHVPTGSDATAWVRVTDDATTLDVRVDAKNEILAQTLVLEAKPTIDDLFKGSEAKALGKIDIVRERNVFVMRGRLTPLMMGMIAAGLP